MDARRARRVAHALWFTTGALWVAALVLVIVDSPQPGSDATLVLIGAIPLAIYGSVGALVARSSPRNPIGWFLVWIGLAAGIWMFGLSYAQLDLDPARRIGGLPGAAAAAWAAQLALPSATPMVLPLFLLFFPDGRLRSRRWRPILWLTVAGGALTIAGALFLPWGEPPVYVDAVLGPGDVAAPFIAGVLTVIAMSFVGVLALVLRFREADAESRQPLRLLVGMLVAMAVSTALALVVNVIPAAPDEVWIVIILAGFVDAIGILFGIPFAAAAAVLTFGLYDVGVVVKKTVVYVALVVGLLAVIGLVALLLNPAWLVGTDAGPGRTGDVIARIVTAGSVILLVLVLAFRPVKGLARRLVYGRRSTPYEALSELSERIGDAYSIDDVLPRMAAIVRAATGAEIARIWLRVGHDLRPIAAAPAGMDATAPVAVEADEPPAIDGSRVFPVRDRGELLGAVSVRMPPAEPLSKTGEQLVVDLAGQAGLVLRNVRLFEELQESRRRIVAAQDERARKLERDLHDGAQQQLVALSVKLGLAQQLTERDPERAVPLIEQAKEETLEALDTLRDLARGIYPPLLADQGLAAALEAQTRKAAIPVALEDACAERFGQAIESAVYFCCLEAMQNIAKYANATGATIRLARSNDHLTFEVADDGVGFDPATARGSGLTNMRDRLEALGGSLHVTSAPSRGTTVRGSIPVESPERVRLAEGAS